MKCCGEFAAFPQIQVIDLDAAMGRGANDDLVEMLASKAVIRAGGGVRTVARAQALLAQGAYRVIVGTSAFSADGPNHPFLESLAASGTRSHRSGARYQRRAHCDQGLAGSDDVSPPKK